MLPPGGNRVAKPWHMLKTDDQILPLTQYKFKPYKGCKLVSGHWWDSAMLHLQCPVAVLRGGNKRRHILYNLVTRVMHFCALQFTYVSVDRKPKLNSPKQESYRGDSLLSIEWVGYLSQYRKKKDMITVIKKKRLHFSASVIALSSAELPSQENSIWSSLWWRHYVTWYALISS